MSDDITAAYAAAQETEAGLGADTAPEPPVADSTPSTESPEAPRVYTVKVRGQEFQVDESELINGYQRQSDYTKSTQELAAERQRLEAAEQLWTALHEDPSTVLAAIQEHFADALNDEPANPLDNRLQDVESFVEQQKQAALETQVANEISRLQSEFGEFDGDTLLEYAIDHKIPDLQAAFLHRQYAEQAAQREADRLKAKQAAPPVAGGSRAQDAHAAPAPKISSLSDALNAAMAELGVSSLSD